MALRQQLVAGKGKEKKEMELQDSQVISMEIEGLTFSRISIQ